MINRCLLLATGIFMFSQLTAQTGNPGVFHLNESLLESVASTGEDAAYETILRELEDLQKRPLDLNSAGRDQLGRLPFLTDFQITSFLDYRITHGNLLSIYELQVIDGFTPEIISLMLPFVRVDASKQTVPLGASQKVSHELALRTQRILETPKGYSNSGSNGERRYPGSPWFLNAHYELGAGSKVRAGITVEKDAGENLFKSSNRAGFDFNSAYIMVRNNGPVKTAIIGDYRVAFGQGLTLWNGASPGKSALSLAIVKRQDAIKPFNSNDENNYFRGLAIALAKEHFTWSSFFSSKNRDANITDTLDNGRIYFSSFQESGNHRTHSEIADEKSVRETVWGTNLLYRNNYLKIGSTLAWYHLDKYLQTGDDLKDIHDFAGNSLLNWGVDFSIVLKKLQFFGESAIGNGKWATIHGMLINVNKYASFSLLYRNFQQGFYSMHSSAFSESSSDSNEEGFYTGMVLHPVAGLKISGYADFYHFPWLKHGKSAPSRGSDYLLQADFSAGKNVTMYLRLKYESDPEDMPADSALIPELMETENTGLRYHIRYRISDKVEMQNRIEYTNSNPGNADASKGYMIYQDFGFRSPSIPMNVDLRIAWFHTDDYSSRIYAYEHDMSSGFSFSPLSGNGVRSYIMASFELRKNVTASIRYSTSWYFDRDVIGSGNDAIQSSNRNDIKIKLGVRF